MHTPEHPKVSVIIVNWNGRHHLSECLESLARQSYRDFEVVLVDNGSADGSIDFVQVEYPWVKTLALAENTGFARGNNIGFEKSSGEYVVTLNNDTWVATDWLELLVATADCHPEVGMVGSRICAFDSPDTIDSLGVQICRDGMSRGAYRGQSFSNLHLTGSMEILLPSACAALYQRRMLEEVGFFDDAFFAYCEDADLGLRCRLAGWKALLALEAVVLHKYSETAGSFSPFKIYLVERNHYWLAIKILPPSRLLFLPFATLMRFSMQGWGVLTNKGAGKEFASGASKAAIISAIFSGIRDALYGLPAAYRKRRAIRAACSISNREQIALLNLYKMTFRELLDIEPEST
jgi:GT2 family glycosyltransferase